MAQVEAATTPVLSEKDANVPGGVTSTKAAEDSGAAAPTAVVRTFVFSGVHSVSFHEIISNNVRLHACRTVWRPKLGPVG